MMARKVIAILGSVRFWALTLAAGAAILNGQDFLLVVQVWLAAVAAVGTVDKLGGN